MKMGTVVSAAETHLEPMHGLLNGAPASTCALRPRSATLSHNECPTGEWDLPPSLVEGAMLESNQRMCYFLPLLFSRTSSAQLSLCNVAQSSSAASSTRPPPSSLSTRSPGPLSLPPRLPHSPSPRTPLACCTSTPPSLSCRSTPHRPPSCVRSTSPHPPSLPPLVLSLSRYLPAPPAAGQVLCQPGCQLAQAQGQEWLAGRPPREQQQQQQRRGQDGEPRLWVLNREWEEPCLPLRLQPRREVVCRASHAQGPRAQAPSDPQAPSAGGSQGQALVEGHPGEVGTGEGQAAEQGRER